MRTVCDSELGGGPESAPGNHPGRRGKPRRLALGLCLATAILGGASTGAYAKAIVVGHDVNTLATFVSGAQEGAFAVNVADFLTAGSTTRNLLMFESNPGDGTRNFAVGVLTALTDAGFSVTVTSDYATPFSAFDAVFVAQDFPTVGFLDNTALINYVDGGGSVYLAGGVGLTPAGEAAGWSGFLNHYGLAFNDTSYNNLNNVAITSSHPIFSGITALRSGNGQSILDLGTNPNAQIVQFAGTQGTYAVVNVPVPEPATVVLFGAGLLALACVGRRSVAQ